MEWHTLDKTYSALKLNYSIFLSGSVHFFFFFKGPLGTKSYETS